MCGSDRGDDLSRVEFWAWEDEEEEGASVAFVVEIEKIEIRENLWLRRREGEKDKFAL